MECSDYFNSKYDKQAVSYKERKNIYKQKTTTIYQKEVVSYELSTSTQLFQMYGLIDHPFFINVDNLEDMDVIMTICRKTTQRKINDNKTWN